MKRIEAILSVHEATWRKVANDTLKKPLAELTDYERFCYAVTIGGVPIACIGRDADAFGEIVTLAPHVLRELPNGSREVFLNVKHGAWLPISDFDVPVPAPNPTPRYLFFIECPGAAHIYDRTTRQHLHFGDEKGELPYGDVAFLWRVFNDTADHFVPTAPEWFADMLRILACTADGMDRSTSMQGLRGLIAEWRPHYASAKA